MEAGHNSAHPAYRPDIDGLRAIAVIAVVIFHGFPKRLPGGFVGVDVFFVISGFLISGIILNGLDRGTFRFSEFYRRRIRRIFPALTIVLITFLVLGWIALLPNEYRQLGKHVAAGAGFVSNVALWKEAGYFDTAGARKPLLHLWSLGIEEQFYLAWPLCLVLLWKQTRKLLPVVVILAAVSFALNVRLMSYPSTSFYMPFTRFWELLLGCVLALTSGALTSEALNRGAESGFASVLLSRRSVDKSPALRNAYAAGGAALILTALLLLTGERDFPGWWALLPGMGAALLILAGPAAWINRNVLSAPWLVFVGLISYPLYLWHWPLLSFATILGSSTDGMTLALIALSVILSWATWKYVESSVRQRRLRNDVAILSVSLGVTGLLGLFLFVTNGFAGRPGAAQASAEVRDITRTFDPPDCSIRSHKFNFCSQSRAGQPQAVVAGDSHANMLIPGLAAADPNRTWLVVGNDSCPPVLGVVADGATKPHCADKMKDVFDYLTSPGTPRLVVLAFYGYYAETTDLAADHLMNGLGPSHYRLESNPALQSKQEVLALGLRNAISLLYSRDKRVVLVIDVPELPFVPIDCVKRPFMKRRNCYVDRSTVDQRQKGLRMIVRRLQQEFPQMSVFDPLPLLCSDNGCDPVGDDFSFYQDSHHLSIRGSERVARGLVAMIDASPGRGAER